MAVVHSVDVGACAWFLLISAFLVVSAESQILLVTLRYLVSKRYFSVIHISLNVY